MSLRLRLALLLIAAIVSVVALASLVALTLIGWPSNDRYFDSVAQQLVTLVNEAEQDAHSIEPAAESDQIFGFRSEPLENVDPQLTASLQRALQRLGQSLRPTVSRAPGGVGLLVSAPVQGRGWMIVTTVEPVAPPGGLVALVSWMVAIVIGATTVALGIAYLMTQPLRLLERTVGSMGEDGVLPVIPETGAVEVRETARVLNSLSARLKTAMEGRMRLVAAAGHDLRTPMTRMRLRAEFVADDEERAAWLNDLDELDQIADSAIGLVREEVDQTSPKLVPLHALVREIVEDLANLGLPIRLGNVEPVLVKAAPWSLKRAFRNLANNAATHGGGGDVSVTYANGKAVVTITDHGPGIPPDLLARVFEPFFQVDPARRRRFGGAGLGLAIAKEIIGRNGGTIALENCSGGGLRQTITFPGQTAES